MILMCYLCVNYKKCVSCENSGVMCTCIKHSVYKHEQVLDNKNSDKVKLHVTWHAEYSIFDFVDQCEQLKIWNDLRLSKQWKNFMFGVNNLSDRLHFFLTSKMFAILNKLIALVSLYNFLTFRGQGRHFVASRPIRWP